MNNLNYEDLDEATLGVLNLEFGRFDSDDCEDVVDTRDTLDDFRVGCQEFDVSEKEANGKKYFSGVIQGEKGTPRSDFLFIPGEPFNLVHILRRA